MKKGRVNELKLGIDRYFKVGEGMETALKNKDIGLAKWKAERLNPMEFFSGHALKDVPGLQKTIKKAQELEDARVAKRGG